MTPLLVVGGIGHTPREEVYYTMSLQVSTGALSCPRRRPDTPESR
jgi:hypothetical protein